MAANKVEFSLKARPSITGRSDKSNRGGLLPAPTNTSISDILPSARKALSDGLKQTLAKYRIVGFKVTDNA